QFLGLQGAQPGPGEVYTGPTSAQDKSNALKNLISRGLNAVAYAAQPPEQARTELARQQFGPTLELEREKAFALLEEAHSWHQATTGERSEHDRATEAAAQKKLDEKTQEFDG